MGMMMQEKGGSKNDYLAGMDLPSSSDDEDVEEKVERDLTKNAFDGPSDKEVAKARKKEIEMARKEAMAKEEAMRDDDDAFNVRLPAMDDQAMAQMANSPISRLTFLGFREREAVVDGYEHYDRARETIRDRWAERDRENDADEVISET